MNDAWFMIGIENKIVDPKVMPVVVVRRKERLQSALDAATESPNVVSTGYGPLMFSFQIFYCQNRNQNPNYDSHWTGNSNGTLTDKHYLISVQHKG